jgi:hypothetical protein
MNNMVASKAERVRRRLNTGSITTERVVDFLAVMNAINTSHIFKEDVHDRMFLELDPLSEMRNDHYFYVRRNRLRNQDAKDLFDVIRYACNIPVELSNDGEEVTKLLFWVSY